MNTPKKTIRALNVGNILRSLDLLGHTDLLRIANACTRRLMELTYPFRKELRIDFSDEEIKNLPRDITATRRAGMRLLCEPPAAPVCISGQITWDICPCEIDRYLAGNVDNPYTCHDFLLTTVNGDGVVIWAALATEALAVTSMDFSMETGRSEMGHIQHMARSDDYLLACSYMETMHKFLTSLTSEEWLEFLNLTRE